MKKLIKLQNKFILVSDEEIIYDDEPYLLIFDKFETYIHKHKGDNIPTDKHFKIIAGIPETKSINLNGFEEELSNITTANVEVTLENNVYLITKIIKDEL